MIFLSCLHGAVKPKQANRLFPKTNNSVLANQPTMHSGEVASGWCATNLATQAVFLWNQHPCFEVLRVKLVDFMFSVTCSWAVHLLVREKLQYTLDTIITKEFKKKKIFRK